MVDKDAAGVGYRRPPRHTQFQPGRSGNPSGRPKTKPSLRTDLANELNETTRVQDGGRERVLSKQRALVKALIDAAIAGDVRAATAVISLTAKVVGDVPADAQEAETETLAPSDDAVIEKFLQRELLQRSSKGESADDQTTGETETRERLTPENTDEIGEE